MRKLLICLLGLALSACAAQGSGDVISSGERYVPVGASNGTIDEYQLGANDKLRLTIYNEPTLSGEFSVSSDGTLSLPLIGDVDAVGKTAKQVSDIIRAKLADGYLRDPRVSMEVITFRPFFILGEVASPGQYPYVNGLTVLNAIATAQGYTPRAQKTVVYIRRAGEAEEKAYKVTPDLRVLPGDTVRIGERYF